MSYTSKPVKHAPSSAFPYTDTTVSYFTVKNGMLYPVVIDKNTIKDIKADDETLFAVWPGQYRSDIFEVDKFDLVKAFL